MGTGEGGGWRPGGGGGGPVRRGPRPDWIPAAQQPKSRNRRYKQAALVVLGLGILIAGYVLWEMLRPPSPPVFLIVTTDPSADAADLGAPIDPYGWMSGQHLRKWSERYSTEAPSEKKRHAPTASNGSDVLKNNETIKTVEDLANWAVGEARHSGQFKKASEAALIFFGLHTGIDADGPFLYANKGRRFHVEELLKHLSEKMGETKVVVLFDPARQLPDPAHGQLHDGFVDGMKALNDKIAGYKNITVVLGCDSGERGWESEELQRTAFAHAVIEGLSGSAAPTRENYVTALDLYKYVQEATKNWTRLNRPTTQNPILLPQGDVGVQRAGETKLALHHTLKDDPAPPPRDPVPALRKKWDEYGTLTDAKGPGPEVYTPRQWRRYRELLLRYEFVARSGEETALGALDAELAKCAAAIRAARQANVIGESRTASVPIWQASGQQPAAAHDSELRPLGSRYLDKPTPDTLKEFTEKFASLTTDRIAYSNDLMLRMLKTAPESLAPRVQLVRTMWESQAIRPPDVQLFLMLDQFFTQLAKEPWPAETDGKGLMLWQRALQVRRLAEEAALGPPGAAHPFSEVVWRIVQPVVQNGDAHRRRAEDFLFAPEAERKAAFGHFDLAEQQYARAVKRAVELRTALALRDEVMADLPYYGRWAVFENDEKLRSKPRDLWKAVHQLARVLDELPPESAEAGAPAVQEKYRELLRVVDEVRDGRDELVEEYARTFEAESKDLVKLQTTWLKREKLLAVPPVRLKPGVNPIEIRSKLVEANRAATRYFLDPANKTPNRTEDERDRTFAKKDRAIALGFLGLNELGEDLVGKQAKVDQLSSWDSVRDEINKINERSWNEVAVAGDRLRAHSLALAKQADPPAADAKAAEAERFSRSAVLYERRDGREPAETNRDFRWQRLFAGQALRAVNDHWYDADRVYFRDVATAFLKDSDALTPPDPTHAADKLAGHDAKALLGFDDPQFRAFDALLKADPLRLSAAKLDSTWTTEPRKALFFKLLAGPLPAEPKPVTWAAFEPREVKRAVRFVPGSPDRKVLALLSGEAMLPVALEAPDAAQAVRETVAVRQQVFFRGQAVKDDASLALYRMPDLIATHVRPAAEPPRVAFLGPNNIDVGAVSIVIDYSPSMTRPPKNNPNGEPRIKRTWVELRKILRDLPDGTDLTIRGFGLAPAEGETIRAEEFESATTRGGTDKEDKDKFVYPGTYDHEIVHLTVNWSRNDTSLSTLMRTLEDAQVYKEKPGEQVAQSPVVRTMLHASREDFARAKEHQTRVLIVLTDGADNSCWDYSNRDEPKLHFDPLMKALEREFKQGKGQGVTVRMLLINDSDSDKLDVEHTKEFEKRARVVLDSFDPPGSVLVGKVEELGKELAELLRPRVRVRHAGKHEPDYVIRQERPEWRLLPEPGAYDSWVGQRPKGDPQDLRLTTADRMLVRLSRANEKDPVLYERILWGRYGTFGEELQRAKRQVEHADKTWLLSAVEYRGAFDGYLGESIGVVGLNTLDLTVAVENLRTTGQPLQQFAPEFTWWELAVDAATPLRIQQSPIYAWRDYRHPAPAWRFRRYGWSEKDENMLPKSSLRGWIEQSDRLLQPQQTTRLTELSTETSAGEKLDGSKWRDAWESPEWTVKFGWEPHAFATNPDAVEPEKPRMCLAVRIYAKDAKRQLVNNRPAPYFVQVDKAKIEEHRYFRDVGAYTGYFDLGPVQTADAAIGSRVRLYSVADLTDPKIGASFELPLPRFSSQAADDVWKRWKDQLEPTQPKAP